MQKKLLTLTQLVLLAVFLLGHQASFGQAQKLIQKRTVPQAALDYLVRNKQSLKLADTDIADLTLNSETVTKHNGLRHLYLKQQYRGIEIHGAVTNMNLTQDGKVISLGDRFQKDISRKIKTTEPGLDAAAAVAAAARHLNVSLGGALTVKENIGGASREVIFNKGGISLEPIPAKLVYQPMEDGSLKLAWEVSIYELSAQNWWNIRLDASTGKVLDKDNMVLHCQFDNQGMGGAMLHKNHSHIQKQASFNFLEAVSAATSNAVAASASYNVYAIPNESPNHTPRTLVSGTAADADASPKGWQYNSAGTYTTITRGNNVYAYEDPKNNNSYLLNYSPDGGTDLNFDFPVDLTQQPVTYRDAAITNLFYMNNIIHDVWYQYGFDEASGNFQLDVLGKGGLGGDPVLAEAQDSRDIPETRNNANFATPRDGYAPRMQMYLWSGIPDANLFQVSAPASIAGSYSAIEGTFSKPLSPTRVTGKLVLVQTATGVSEQGCEVPSNAAAINGNIAVVYRGTCGFADKVQNAQKAGAIAVVVINNAAGGPITMGGTPTSADPAIVIPAIMISQADGSNIRTQLNAGVEVVVTLKNDGSGPEFDGDFDNGIIAHEYGHGISNRLTGGALNTSCLGNAEQGGEGWSDWFALMMTMKTGDKATKSRGIGTYASAQPTTGLGIRPAPYTTDMSVNSYTYGAVNNTSLAAPHGVGFVWATMLWDMTWAFVDKYGYDADLYHGNGGNNMAMQLVIDGLKMQVCSPGFVDARDAILAADQADYGGANQEMIWQVFARRGLGYSAKQGLSTSRTDQVEAFDMPPVFACEAPVITVKPTSDVFTGGDAKTIYLGYGPQNVNLTANGDPTFKYTWTPAVGLSDATIANPVFTPTATGTYTFTVTGVNANECTRTASVTINVVDVRCGTKNDKVQVCHSGKVLCIVTKDVAAHLTHGDNLGTCSQVATAGLAGENLVVAQDELKLSVRPNPSNSKTNIEFTLTEKSKFRLEVLNMQGAVVSVLDEREGDAGETFTYEFNKGKLAHGVYITRLITDKESKFTKIVFQP